LKLKQELKFINIPRRVAC